MILPIAGISYGIGSLYVQELKSVDNEILIWRSNNRFRKHSFDDVTALIPSIAYFGMKLYGIPSQHDKLEIVTIGLSALTLQYGSVQLLKNATQRLRPDNSNLLSFPSGHTALAFAGAELIRLEYGKTNAWYSIIAYSIATITGTMRVINNRHWLSDVIMGAGIGYTSAHLSYHLVPALAKCIKKKSTSNQSF